MRSGTPKNFFENAGHADDELMFFRTMAMVPAPEHQIAAAG
jgi:hypothetical protein